MTRSLETRQEEAIEASITVWDTKLDADIHDLKFSAEGCPLCREFMNNDRGPEFDSCQSCPVRLRTGQACCSGSPYYDVLGAFNRALKSIDLEKGEYEVASAMGIMRSKIREECRFLRSLRKMDYEPGDLVEMIDIFDSTLGEGLVGRVFFVKSVLKTGFGTYYVDVTYPSGSVNPWMSYLASWRFRKVENIVPGDLVKNDRGSQYLVVTMKDENIPVLLGQSGQVFVPDGYISGQTKHRNKGAPYHWSMTYRKV